MLLNSHFSTNSSILYYYIITMADHPLAQENLPVLKALQAEGQKVSGRGYSMQLSGFFHWGFVVYRCDYSDNELWARYMAQWHQITNDYMTHRQEDRTTAPYLEWTVIEDKEKLAGASKEDAKELFRVWRRELSVERDGLGADHPMTRELPRFKYCVHVGCDSLDSLMVEQQFKQSGVRDRRPPVTFVLVSVPDDDVPKKSDEDNDGSDDESEDLSDGYDIGWMHVPLKFWVVAYEDLHSDNNWHSHYKRPPAVMYW